MKGSKEIDTLIATKVLGKEISSETDLGGVWIVDESDGIPFLFRPSENMRDAWLVAEKFWRIEIEKENSDYYTCIHTGTTNLDCEYGSELCYFAEAKSAPMAICMAALQAYGIDFN